MNPLKSEECLQCGAKTVNAYLFCENCTPIYGESVCVLDKKTQKQLSLFIGKIPFWSVIFSRFKGQLPVKWWMGTDALTMWFRPPGKSRFEVALHRLKMRMLEPFIFQHWVTGARLIDDLRQSGSIDMEKVVVAYWPGKFHAAVEKIEHEGFNVLYYDPDGGEFERWKYGIDLIEQIKEKVRDVNWIKINGTQDVKTIYPIIDLYLRPSRHDGEPRINIECELNDIPVLYSEDGRPSVDDFVEQINEIKKTIG